MGSIYTSILPKALAAGAPPQTPNSERERLLCLPVWHAELKMVLTQLKNVLHSHPKAPKSVFGWGPAPDPLSSIAIGKSDFGACQSDTPSWKWC